MKVCLLNKMLSKTSILRLTKLKVLDLCARCCCTNKKEIRNIGILAHIDAGKTTLTERLLFYAGKTNSMGEVHRGNTVTDYLQQERERGITVCSSAVTFPWNNTKINLLDTPGHIDFTMEVEQSLNAVDGVVIVLDGTAGVEAQTFTVWSQADKFQLPKIVFVNKMDRPDANFSKCLNDINSKLGVEAISLQHPVKDSKGTLSIIDVINKLQFSWVGDSLGRIYRECSIQDDTLQKMQDQRNRIIDELTQFDDNLAEFVINNESYNNVSNTLIWDAVRRATCERKIVPVLLGSAYKNIGIQLLGDSIVKFLPTPFERNQFYDCFGNDFVGKVFKIVHNKQRGPLTLVRVLRGVMKKGMRVTTAKGSVEILQKIYEPLADEFREINEISAGDVAVCSGLKNTSTGDLLVTNASSLVNAQNNLKKSKVTTEENIKMFSLEPHIPDAVYFCSIEPPNLSSQNAMEIALKQLQREDPSLRVKYDDATGQTVLGGMGELHIDIMRSRILTEYKIDVDLGPLQIAYKECANVPITFTWNVEKEIAGSKQSVAITMELVDEHESSFSLNNSPDNSDNLNAIRPRILQIIKKGALSAFERGPRVGGEVVKTQIRLHNVVIGRGTADSFIMAASAQCIQKMLNNCGTRILEPLMSLEITVSSERVSAVLADLSRRRAVIKDVAAKGEKNKVIYANAPLAELTGYSTLLRTITSGTASVTMQPCGYANMSSTDELIAVRRAQGLE